MNAIQTVLGKMSAEEVAKVAAVEEMSLRDCPQLYLHTEHVFHAGVYARTIMLPAGGVLTGALIKIDTILILNGDAHVYGEGGAVRITGHNVMMGRSGRKQLIVAISDTYLTMLFATKATTVEGAEQEFTDEFDRLMSRHEREM